MSGHTCHAEGCDRAVAPRMLACLSHWRMVPRWLQAALWRVYVPGQERRKDPTPAYLLVQTRCRLAIAATEEKPDALIDVLREETAERFLALVPERSREEVRGLGVSRILELVDRTLKAGPKPITPG